MGLSVQGMMGEGCWPHGCHWQQYGRSVTGAAVTVIAVFRTQGEGQTRVTSRQSPSFLDAQKKLEVYSLHPLAQSPEKGVRGT